MTVLTATIYGAVNSRAAVSITYCNIRLVDITQIELRAVFPARCESSCHIGRCYTTATAKHVTRRHVIFLAVRESYSTAVNLNIGITAVKEVVSKIRFVGVALCLSVIK